jgi:site-specific DNA recombinase
VKAIGYIRVSSEGQAESGLSLAGQEEKIRQYCKLKDLNLIEVVEDAGISAKNLKRIGVQRVLGMASRKEFDALVIYKLDRMFRSTVDALETSALMDKWGVALHSIEESLNTKSAMGEFFFTLMAALAQMERKMIGERTRFALAKKKANGEKCGGLVPYGYTSERGVLTEDTEEQITIKGMHNAYGLGMSLREICQSLNDNHIPTRTGSPWHPATVAGILRRK